MIKGIKAYIKKKQAWWNNISNGQHYKQEQKYLTDITFDFINTIRIIAMYSNRAPHIYNSFLTITTIDDLIESSMAILMMVNNGIHNASKRELRYILEMSVKYCDALALILSMTRLTPSQTVKSVNTSTILPLSVNGASCNTDR